MVLALLLPQDPRRESGVPASPPVRSGRGLRTGWADGWSDWQYRSTARNRPRARTPTSRLLIGGLLPVGREVLDASKVRAAVPACRRGQRPSVPPAAWSSVVAATRYRAPRGAHLAVLDEQRRDQPPPLAGAEARVRAGGPSRCGAHHRHSCSPATRPRGSWPPGWPWPTGWGWGHCSRRCARPSCTGWTWRCCSCPGEPPSVTRRDASASPSPDPHRGWLSQNENDAGRALAH
jgi:hypothetical protein